MATGIQLKEQGLLLAESRYKDSLTAAQFIAQLIGGLQPMVTTDDIFLWMSPKAVGNAAGAIFRSDYWLFVNWQESVRESNHGRFIRAWALK